MLRRKDIIGAMHRTSRVELLRPNTLNRIQLPVDCSKNAALVESRVCDVRSLGMFKEEGVIPQGIGTVDLGFEGTFEPDGRLFALGVDRDVVSGVSMLAERRVALIRRARQSLLESIRHELFAGFSFSPKSNTG
jgi:hypothetical protein